MEAVMTDAHEAEISGLEDVELADTEWDVVTDEDRSSPERPCGDPLAHDRLLAVLRRVHPQGHENVAEAAGRPPRWRASRVDVSLTGCSASLCADAA
jgi:hypothetical protein